MRKQPGDEAGGATVGGKDDRLLSEAREVFADVWETLRADQQRRADLRDAAADERDRRADARDQESARQQAEDRRLREELERRAERLRELIEAADARDRAAEIRDRAAEARQAAAAVRAHRQHDDQRLAEEDHAQTHIDRLWAGADRDAAALDRAELRQLAEKDQPTDQ